MTPGRIILFGATGYTGDGTARALVRRGVRPVLAARSPEKLGRLAEELGGLETAIADVEKPESVRALVKRGDVLISTVGPFSRFGAPAIESAVDAGAIYIDSTGEPPFIQRVFDHYGPRAEKSGATLLTAFAFDWVPGNLAGALALTEAGEAATSVEIGYFAGGGMSGGTRSSAVQASLGGSFAFRDGELRSEASGKRVGTLNVPGLGRRDGLSVGGSEHYGLSRHFSQLKNVEVMLGRRSPILKAMPVAARMLNLGLSIPGARKQVQSLAAKQVSGSTGGPSPEQRAASKTTVTAIAYDDAGNQLSQVTLGGANAYDFTFTMLAWTAAELLGTKPAAGALTPLEAFSIEDLERGVADAGISRIDD